MLVISHTLFLFFKKIPHQKSHRKIEVFKLLTMKIEKWENEIQFCSHFNNKPKLIVPQERIDILPAFFSHSNEFS